MGYIREAISTDDQQKIMQDARYDSRRYNRLRARGGYFERLAINPLWAVDRDKNYYFFRAPPRPRDPIRRYYFYYKCHLYMLIQDRNYTENRFVSEGHFDEVIEHKFLLELESEIKLAYQCFDPFWSIEKYGVDIDINIVQPEELLCQ